MKRENAPFLIAGALGLVAALLGAIGAPRVQWSGDAAAIVNGVPIPREALARAVLALEGDSRNPVTPAREEEVLRRLIEEELLVQRGVELGLADTDFAARRALVQSVLSLAVAERSGAEPSDAELRRFYRDNAGFFAPNSRFAASVVFVRADARSQTRLEQVRHALEGGASSVGLGDPTILPMPRGALDLSGWRRLLGPEIAASASRLAPGEISPPIAARDGFYLVRLDGFAAAPAPPYEAIAPQVRAEWDRRADEATVRAYIARLARAARIERRPRARAP